jgi:hypothetical protein
MFLEAVKKISDIFYISFSKIHSKNKLQNIPWLVLEEFSLKTNKINC